MSFSAFNNMRTAFTLLLLLLGAALGVSANATASPHITLEARAIAASGVTPGGRVIFFGSAHEAQAYVLTYAHWDRTLIGDAEGNARLVLDHDVSPRSVWAVVDVTTGQFAMITNFPQKTLAFPPGALRRDSSGDVDAIGTPFEVADMLVVRKGTGAWSWTVAEGGPHDNAGHPSGQTLASVARFQPLADPKLQPLTRLLKGDFVIIIDARSLLSVSTEVDK